ncbi:hypothetical protein [Bacillus alkalicellulosilyticus]|uniref:hypothetical protein n=1 Tax=Alkalihalobacterium alkalicellulosilyticum TaxID=1912214 RepID=UPI000998B81E|nr:hypothetical protein [Bacillus alkalicellulosilyticus]
MLPYQPRGLKYFLRTKEEMKQTIETIMKRESTDIITLDFLMVIAPTEQAQKVLKHVLRVRSQTNEQLKQLYYEITGEILGVDQETFNRPDDFTSGIQEQIELQNIRVRRLENLHQQSISAQIGQQRVSYVMYEEKRILGRLKFLVE